MLEVRNLDASYGEVRVLSQVHLEVPEGTVVSVVGVNGAGKTTLMKAILGVETQAVGEILYQGENIVRWPTDRRVEAGIVMVPEGRRLFANMTVRENLEMGCYTPRARKYRQESLERVFTLLPKLKERERQPAGSLSGGEQQMVALGRALMARPTLLLLDEPTLGLAPIMVRWVFEFIRELKEQGLTILLVEQNASTALRLSDRGYILAGGSVAAEGSGEELLHRPDLRQVYMG
ncbi:MAG: ABC transporter ATP-binding protein, partial [Alicyclobacillaceae bacterium]|nr:ABC transporter ATP-binding protein [Alicyclobacillaceae bacterium]